MSSIYDINMSTKSPSYCFNGNPAEDTGECIYAECGMYLEEIDICKLEYLKGSPAPVTKKRQPVFNVTPQPSETQIGGTRLISSLSPGDTSSRDNKINVKGTLVLDPIQVERNTKDGPLNVTNFTIEDESGKLKLGVWGDDGNAFMDYKKGDKLFIENVYKIKEPYDGVLQADLGKYFKVAKIN